MPFTTRKTPGFEGVAAGQTATLRLPIGRSYNRLLIGYSGVTLAQINGIRVIANGEIIQKWTEATKLDIINKFEGRAAAAGVLTLDFERYGCLKRESREVTVLGTGIVDRELDPNPISTLSLEIDIDAAAVGPALTCKAVQSLPRANGFVKKVREYTYVASAAGVYEISDIPKRGIYNKISFGGHTANVYKSLVVERNNFIVFERTAAENIAAQTDGVRVPQADYFVYDPTEDGYGAEGLVSKDVSDLRFKLDLTNAGTITVTVESLEPLEA